MCVGRGGGKGWVGEGVGGRGVATFFTTLQFSSVTFTLCVGKVRYPFILFWIFSLLS